MQQCITFSVLHPDIQWKFENERQRGRKGKVHGYKKTKVIINTYKKKQNYFKWHKSLKSKIFVFVDKDSSRNLNFR